MSRKIFFSMPVEHKEDIEDINSEWSKSLDKVDVDPEDIKSIVLNYLLVNNLSQVSDIFIKEANIDSSTIPHEKRTSLDSFYSALHSREYTLLISNLKDLNVLASESGFRVKKLLDRVLFRLHQLVAIQMMVSRVNPDEILEYVRLHNTCADLRDDLDAVLMLLVSDDVDNAADSVEKSLCLKLEPELIDALSIHFDLDRESRLAFLLKTCVYTQNQTPSVPRLDELTFSAFI